MNKKKVVDKCSDKNRNPKVIVNKNQVVLEKNLNVKYFSKNFSKTVLNRKFLFINHFLPFKLYN